MMEDALAADPTAFEYDGVYREMKKEEIARKASTQDTGPKKAPQPLYFILFLKLLYFTSIKDGLSCFPLTSPRNCFLR